MLVGRDDFQAGLSGVGIPPGTPVIAHASLSAFGSIEGGAGTVVEALLEAFPTVIMPAFTYKTMVIPEVGPPNNAMFYGSGRASNQLAQIYHAGMPVDRLIGTVPEHLRQHPLAQRSSHPILSFAGVNAGFALERQSLEDPLAPLQTLMDAGGWVLLLGVDLTTNTSIHLGEKLAGRRQFLRWALTGEGVVECPGFPGCSEGFEALRVHLKGYLHSNPLGKSKIEAVPMDAVIDATRALLAEDRLALLCDRSYCERCYEIRRIDSLLPPA